MLVSFLRPIMSVFEGIYTTNGLTMFRTKAAKEVGCFDENNLTEDMDICMKLYAAGYKIKGDVHPHSYTLPVNKFSTFVRQRRRWQVGMIDNFMAHFPTIKKHPGMKYVTFPISFAWIGLITGLFIRTVYNVTDSLINFMSHLKAINYDILFYLKELFANPTFLRFNIVTTTMMVSSFIFISLLIFATSRIEDKKKLKAMLNTPIYVLTYSILLTITWLSSYAYIIKSRGKRQAWTHET